MENGELKEVATKTEKTKVHQLKTIVDSYMKRVSGVQEHCDRCIRTERWGGNVVLMIVDAAFTSIGLNYFTAVVPKVVEFDKKFVERRKITILRELAEADLTTLRTVWRNQRSWTIAKNIASYLSNLPKEADDRKAMRTWARNSSLVGWKKDPIGGIKGVGIVTFQYLRMMGGVDTVMPDKIVKRVINEILEKASLQPVDDNVKFVKKTEDIASTCGYRPVELCWMTWLVQPEGKIMRMNKYSNILSKI